MSGTNQRSRTVRELSGELASELRYGFVHPNERVNWEVFEEMVDMITAVLARHAGTTIVMDEDLPVEPLPLRFPPEDDDSDPGAP